MGSDDGLEEEEEEEEEEGTQGAGAPKNKKSGGCDRMKVEIMTGGVEAKCAMVCATTPPFTHHRCVCGFNIIVFWGVLLSWSPSLRIKQPACRVES